MRELRGRRAVLTGAAGGIGEALARRLAAEGMELVLVDLREDALGSLQRALSTQADVRARALDVADREAWNDLAEEVASVGGADLLVNNAGLTIHGAFADQSPADLDRIVDVNLRGVLHGCRVFLPQLRARGEAHIVNVSSLAGRVGFPYQSTYCATKHAIRGFGAALRMELEAEGIGVTTVMPGAVATELMARARSYDDPASSTIAQLMLRHGLPPARLAARIVRAIERDEAEVLVGWDAHVLSAAAALSPGLIRRGLGAAFRRRREAQKGR